MIATTNASGAVVSQAIYDPWGKRSTVYLESLLANFTYSEPTDRGYTGHKHIKDLDIIHMGGRIYDPTIGRFLQADPNIQAPLDSQSYNRYAYVRNNPMSMTDPSGYSWLSNVWKKYGKLIIAAVATVITYGAASGYLMAAGFTTMGTVGAGVAATCVNTLSFAGSMMAGAAAGFVGGAISTGSLKGAVNGALSGAAFGAVGFGQHGLGWGESTQIAAHAVTGGILSEVQGGNFGHGFISAGIMKGVGKVLKNPLMIYK